MSLSSFIPCGVSVNYLAQAVAKTSAPKAQVGRLRPAETLVLLDRGALDRGALNGEHSKLHALCLSGFSGRREAVCRGGRSTG